MKIKRIISLITAVALLAAAFCVLPPAVGAVDTVELNIYDGAIRILKSGATGELLAIWQDNMPNRTCPATAQIIIQGDGVTPTSNKITASAEEMTVNLTFKDLIIETSGVAVTFDYGVDINLTLEGENSLSSTNNTPIRTLLPGTDLVILGAGSLTTNGGDMPSGSGNNLGMLISGSVTVNSGTLKCTGGTSVDSNSIGIYVSNYLTVNDNGSVEGNGGEALEGSSYGVEAYTGLRVYGGTVNGTGKTARNTSCGIYVDNNLTVSDGTVIGNGDTAIHSYGVFADGLTDITGGSLSAQSGSATYRNSTESNSFGFYAEGGLNVTGGTVNGKGGTANSASGAAVSRGVSASQPIQVSAGSVTGIAEQVTGNTNSNSHGIYSQSTLTVNGTGSIEGTGGKATTGSSYGIRVNSRMTLGDSGSVKGTGGEAVSAIANSTAVSCGVSINNSLTLSGGVLTGEGGSAQSVGSAFNYGVHTDYTVNITNGVMTGKGGSANGGTGNVGSYGLYLNFNTVTVSGGTVSGEGGSATKTGGGDTATILSSGLFVSKAFSVSGGTVNGKGSSAANSGSASAAESCGVYLKDNMTVSNSGAVVGTGGSGKNSYGINAVGVVTVSGGDLTGKAGSADGGLSRGVNWSTTAPTFSAGSLIAVGNSDTMKGQINLTSSSYYHRSDSTVTPSLDFSIYPTEPYTWSDTQKYAEIRDYLLPVAELTGGNASFPVGSASADTEFTLGENLPDSVSFDLSNYDYTEVGGTRLTDSQVTAANGSVILTFSEAYLNSLPAGTYNAAVHLKGGSYSGRAVTIEFVISSAAPTPSSPADTGRTNPDTGVITSSTALVMKK